MEVTPRVKTLLEHQFPGSHVDVGIINGSQRVSGSIVWEGFEDQEQIDRQRTLWAFLREALGSDAQNVSAILTYTPNEYGALAAA